jgi:hypothetical protein
VIDEAGRKLILQRNGQLGALVNTPGQILNEMDAVDRLVDGLGVAVNSARKKLGKSLVSQVEAFWNEWKAFYGRNKGLGARLWGGVYEQTIAYRDRAMQWQARLQKAGADVTPDQIAPPPDPNHQVLVYIGIGVVALIGLSIAAKLIHTIVLGNSELGQTGRSRRGRARERRWTLAEAEDAAISLMDAKRRRRKRSRRAS